MIGGAFRSGGAHPRAGFPRRDRHRRLRLRGGADRELVPDAGRDPDDQLAFGGLGSGAVISNDDEMELGAIQTLKASGREMDSVIVACIDATRDAPSSRQVGDLDVTMFQDAAGGDRRGAVTVAGRGC